MPRASWWLLAASLALTAGCRPDKLGHTSGELDVETRALLFPDTYVGFPNHQAIKLANTSPGVRKAQVTVDGPFSAPAEVSVSGGTTFDLVLTFAPGAAGLASGTVHVASEGVTSDVLVSATALQPPDCGSPPACIDRHFDPSLGRCVEANRPDGFDCGQGNGCLKDATCQGGVCVGQAADCDDHNPCTADSCDPNRGCVHDDLTSMCPTPADPCKVAFCDPASGCGQTDAADGTVCGSVDCVTAHVCLLGMCQAVSVPEGTECAPPTPCQGPGACHGGECVQPDAGPMVPVWSYGTDAGTNLYFPGLTDDQDNLVWVECGTDCQLLSATPTGVIRFRAPISWYFPASDYSSRGRLMVGGGLVYLSDGAGNIEAHAARDGSLVWTTSAAGQTRLGLTDGGPDQDPPGTWSIGPLMLNGGRLLAPGLYTYVDGRPQPYETHLLSLDPATGRLMNQTVFSGYVTGPIGDGQGNAWMEAYVPPADPDAGQTFISERMLVGPSADIHATVVDPAGRSPSAAWGRWLFVDDNNYQEQPGPEDGGLTLPGNVEEWLDSSNWYGWYGWYGYGYDQASPVVDDRFGFAITSQPPSPTVNCPANPDDAGGNPCGVPYMGPAPVVVGFNPVSGQVVWTLTLDDLGASDKAGYAYYGAAFSPPMLTDRGTLLVATGGEPYSELADAASMPTDPVLHEVHPSGVPLYACPLAANPDGSYYDYLGGVALTHGRWVVARGIWSGMPRIEAYDVEGAVPASRGWVTLGGTPGQTNAPLGASTSQPGTSRPGPLRSEQR